MILFHVLHITRPPATAQYNIGADLCISCSHNVDVIHGMKLKITEVLASNLWKLVSDYKVIREDIRNETWTHW
jgi:hypothetical protein